MARTLLIDDWTYHTARVHKKNRQDYQPSGVLGTDVLDFVEKALPVGASFDKKEKQRWVRVDDVRRSGRRSLLVKATAGAYGESGEVVDRRDSSVAFTLEPDHATTAATRMLVLVPDVGLHAFAFIERSTGRGSAGLDLVGQLKQTWLEKGTGATWKQTWIQDADPWLESGDLKVIQVKRYRGSSGTTSPDVENLGAFEYAMRAQRGKFFKKKILEEVLKDASKANELIGIEHEDGDRLFLEVALGRRVAKFAVEEGKLPRVQAVLDDQLDDNDFIKCCIENAQRVCDQVGLTYQPEWVSRLQE